MAGVVSVFVVAIWLLFTAARWLQVRTQACRDLGALGWFHAFVRQELPHYYENHGCYPTNLRDVLLANYGHRAKYGDNFKTNMLSQMVYTTDGKSFTFTWNTPDGRSVVLSGESGQITTDSW